MLKRCLSTLLLMGALPSTAIAQSTDTLFLTCNTARQYKGSDAGKTLPETLYVKINTKTFMISEFNADLSKYEDMCEHKGVTPKMWEWRGTCLMDDEVVTLIVNRGGLTSTWKNYRIYRGSGRISGSVSVYFGVVMDFKEMLEKTPMVSFDIVGSCQKGVDMSMSKKAF
jgi:hypothetical protein